jgi:hypothetical protein
VIFLAQRDPARHEASRAIESLIAAGGGSVTKQLSSESARREGIRNGFASLFNGGEAALRGSGVRVNKLKLLDSRERNGVAQGWGALK